MFREEFDAEYQDKLAEYEEELKEWKKETKRRVNNVSFIDFFVFNFFLFMHVSILMILCLLSRKGHAKKDKSQV